MIPLPEIRAAVVRELVDNQEIGGRCVPDTAMLTDEFCPMEDLDGFDSLNALEGLPQGNLSVLR